MGQGRELDGARPVLVLATRSAGKLRELGPLLSSLGWMAKTLEDVGCAPHPDEELIEDQDSFEGNALAKAQWYARRTGLVVVADDSGLMVDALDGRPGVHSKRWSGSSAEGAALDAENNAYLQSALAAAACAGRTERTARYVCAAACVWGETSIVRVGETAGVLLTEARGGGGFGYDPFFLSSELGRTFAEVSREEKAMISHRGRAFRALLQALGSAGVSTGLSEFRGTR